MTLVTDAASAPTESNDVAHDGVRIVNPHQLAQWLKDDCAVVVDVREPDEFRAERIPGALNRPLSRLDPQDFSQFGDRTIVLHCRSGSRSNEAASRLIAAGHDQVCHLEGGIRGWMAADLPVARLARAPISIMRQVQISAGSLVVAGTLLGFFASPWFLLLSGFVGAGLIFAGLSGTCGMASMLIRMPWNRLLRNAATCET